MYKKPLKLLNSLVKTVAEVPDGMLPQVPADVPTQALAEVVNQAPTILSLNVPDVSLSLQVFNWGNASILPVTSTLIIGPTEMALVDAQFQTNIAQDLVKLIKSHGKKLTQVFISHEHPDCYFGGEVIQKAFPECPFYATKDTIERIKSSKAARLAFWSPTLGKNAPRRIIVPHLLKGNVFTVDGHQVQIKTPFPNKSFCWVPSMKAILGCFSVFGHNVHLWLVEDQTTKLRHAWYQTLALINDHYPDFIVPSHFYPGSECDVGNIEFTERYLSEVERQLPLAHNSAEFVDVMREKYPNLEALVILEISAKVLKGEMKW